jgi:hypothetical protein
MYPEHIHDADYGWAEDAPEPKECACNACGITQLHDDTLDRSIGRVCPYCGEGVIQESQP